MKKILISFIFGACVLMGAVPMADAASVVGDKCMLPDGTQIASGNYKTVKCESYGLANADPDQCFVYCDNGNLVPGVRGCKYGFYKFEQLSTPSDLYSRCVDKETACRESRNGAQWNDGKCDCGGNDYEWDDVNLRCVWSQEFENCKNAGADATWNNTAGHCECITVGFFWNGSECVKAPNKEECDSLSSNSAFKGQVKWNQLANGGTGKCECTKGKSGENVVNVEDWMIDVFIPGCVKKPSVLRREEYERNKPEVQKKQNEINSVIDDLKDISDGWSRSRWKNADGGFNTARLASDSIAGVVLGTVGGVITSNVIKKNQVKGGFEDINCTIGGQNVAGYADQFRVGLQ